MHQLKDIDWLGGYKNKTHIYAVYKRPTSDLGTYRLKVKEQEKVFCTNWNQKKAGVAILILDKIDFKTKTAIRDKEVDYVMIKCSIQEVITTIIYMHPT